MDFSPYKPSPDDNRRHQDRHGKGKSRSGAVGSKNSNSSSAGTGSDFVGGANFSSYQAGTINPSLSEEGLAGPSFNGGAGAGGTVRVNKYETRLPIRVDIEAALTYVLGPITGILFLILETKNDYVRFHAWQSSVLFLALMCVHFVLMFISSFLSWTLFAIDILLILGLSYRAYLDGASLERTMMPYFGPMAAEWVDSE